MLRIAGLDAGNDSIKVVLDGTREPIIIPNIIAPGYDRFILQEEDSPLKALDVIIHSPSLAKNNVRYFVGLLATENEDSSELEETDNKAISDQSLIVALTALAVAGLANPGYGGPSFNAGENQLEYIVGTGLPVRTYMRYHKQFEQRLVGEHEITFMTTPQLSGRKVKLSIRKAVVSIEGAAALFNLATLDNLQIKNEEIYYGCIGVCEIGALTTDFPIVKRMTIDNQFSHGEQTGLAAYLDPIIKDVEDAYGYRFPSRSKLVQRIIKSNFIIQRIGEGQADFKPIVNTYFTRAAHRIVDLIKKRWNKFPDTQCFYVLGGGAAALKPYLLEAAGPIRLRFVENSELQNMYGYLKVAKNRVNQSSLNESQQSEE